MTIPRYLNIIFLMTPLRFSLLLGPSTYYSAEAFLLPSLALHRNSIWAPPAATWSVPFLSHTQKGGASHVGILKSTSSSLGMPAYSSAEEVDSQAEIPSDNNNSSKLFFCALEPGSTVNIQVGDVKLARKAWKKRRRNESPLLVPISISDIHPQSAVRWNIVYLVRKFGISQGPFLRLAVEELSKKYRSHLKTSLHLQATQLGYANVVEMVQDFLSKQGESTGVEVVDDEGDEAYLRMNISRMKAQRQALKSAMLQFTTTDTTGDRFQHTGMVRVRSTPDHQSLTGGDFYRIQPLSAALRVSQEDLETIRHHEGSSHTAYLWEYDPTGDAGVAPLLTVSLHPTRSHHRTRQSFESVHDNPYRQFHDLTIGDAMTAKVVRLVKGGAIVDAGVGRVSSQGNTTVKVYGLLNFQDAAADMPDKSDKASMSHSITLQGSDSDENDDEFEEVDDITHLFEIDADGLLAYRDPSLSGQDMNAITGSPDESLESSVSTRPDTSAPAAKGNQQRRQRRRILHVGDILNVYVKSVSKQSKQLVVTMDPSIRGMTASAMKKELHRTKKLARLVHRLGDWRRMHDYKGDECDGVVEATSNVGGRLFVRPNLDLPVGVASASTESVRGLAKGDHVRIRILGVDETQVHLAVEVLRKLHP